MTDDRDPRRIPFRAMVPNAVTALALCFGLTGVSLATALAATLYRGLGPLVLGCRLVPVKFGDYARRVLGPNAAFGLVAGGAALAIDHWVDPHRWDTFVLAGFLCATAFIACAAPMFYSMLPSRQAALPAEPPPA